MSQKFKRFRDFENGLKAAYDNYKKWQDNPELHTLNKAHKNRPPMISLYVQPFAQQGNNSAANVYYQAQAQNVAWSSYSTAIGTRTKTSKASTDLVFTKYDRTFYNPAKVIIKTGILTTPTKRTSHITKRKYDDYGGTSVSIPFGRKDNTEGYAAAIIDIETDLNAPATTRVTFKPEVYRG
jgi:hypothetical protein